MKPSKRLPRPRRFSLPRMPCNGIFQATQYLFRSRSTRMTRSKRASLGSRGDLDGHPLRWQTIQAVLHLIRSLLPALVHQFPQSIEVVGRVVGGYPLIYFLRTDAEISLISQIVQAICKGQTSILLCAEMSASSQKDIESFISSPKVAPEIVNRVLEMFRKKKHWMKVT